MDVVGLVTVIVVLVVASYCTLQGVRLPWSFSLPKIIDITRGLTRRARAKLGWC